MKASEFELLQKAISVYGAVAQTDMAIEEMGELIVAINHYRRGRVGMDAVKEEIADVMIAMKQLAMIYGEAGVEIFIEKKMHRLEQRLTIHEAKYKENQNNPKKASGLAARLEAMQKQVEEMQKQTEWGEDDEAFLDDVLCKLEHDLILNKDEKDWLKSLKNRVQPKQEWGEEDEQHIDSLLKRIDSLCRNKFERTRFAISEDIDWLKSLRKGKENKI